MSIQMDAGKIATTLGAFAYAIKNGKKWDDVYERSNEEAYAALRRLANSDLEEEARRIARFIRKSWLVGWIVPRSALEDFFSALDSKS